MLSLLASAHHTASPPVLICHEAQSLQRRCGLHLRPTQFPVYAYVMSFASLLLSQRQHLVQVVDYSLPGRDSHPARDTKLRLAHTMPKKFVTLTRIKILCWDGTGLWVLTKRLETRTFSWTDNNLVENAIRPTALGKKNWLFIGDADAGQRSAIIYTVIENCRKRSLDPFAYLRDVWPLASVKVI
jgi:IS66 Orf2 like protein/Transposase IS66 family